MFNDNDLLSTSSIFRTYALTIELVAPRLSDKSFVARGGQEQNNPPHVSKLAPSLRKLISVWNNQPVLFCWGKFAFNNEKNLFFGSTTWGCSGMTSWLTVFCGEGRSGKWASHSVLVRQTPFDVASITTQCRKL